MAQIETHPADIRPQSRALVVLSGPASRAASTGALFLPDAGFLTQIMASAGHMGHFRRYRRAEPQLAMNSYRAAAALIG